MKISHWVVMVLSAQVQRQTNKTASEILTSLKFKSLPSLKLFNKPITTMGVFRHEKTLIGNSLMEINFPSTLFCRTLLLEKTLTSESKI